MLEITPFLHYGQWSLVRMLGRIGLPHVEAVCGVDNLGGYKSGGFGDGLISVGDHHLEFSIFNPLFWLFGFFTGHKLGKL